MVAEDKKVVKAGKIALAILAGALLEHCVVYIATSEERLEEKLHREALIQETKRLNDNVENGLRYIEDAIRHICREP